MYKTVAELIEYLKTLPQDAETVNLYGEEIQAIYRPTGSEFGYVEFD